MNRRIVDVDSMGWRLFCAALFALGLYAQQDLGDWLDGLRAPAVQTSASKACR